MRYFAHSNDQKNKLEWHLLKDHLEDTAKLSANFTSKFGLERLGYLAGLLHDVGKYSIEFQKRLEGAKNRVDHSTAGAKVAINNYSIYGILLAYVIAGHHCGLTDWGSKADDSSLSGRINKKTLADYSSYVKEISLPELNEMTLPFKACPVGQGFSIYFLIRMLYSSLVDADFLDTERALQKEKSNLRGCTTLPLELLSLMESYIYEFCNSVPDSLINRQRAIILDSCRKKSSFKKGFFTLTVPTGGGKTLSSMVFALNHAVNHGMDRVIYVIPYVSIIEQNAEVFKKIFGGDVVLEHHSNYTFPENDSMEKELGLNGTVAEKIKLAAENWDIPVVVTTNVQFFESLFAVKSSSCRKLHNISNSVVVIDEAQMIPTGYLLPCLNTLAELVTNYNTSVVLCTATQPYIKEYIPGGINVSELIDNPEEIYRVFQRVQVKYSGFLPDDTVAKKMLSLEQVLCIVNSKKHARIIFEKINENEAFHLSARMCPVHRSETLKTVKERLKNRDICRLVSTQLIEAGVDIDFPVVFRSSAGIDSIAQSAGRCNREGILDKGTVYVFRPEKHGMPAGWLSKTAAVGEIILSEHKNPLSLEGIKDYFSMLYNIEGDELDKERIIHDICEQQKALNFPFRKIAEKFKIIDEHTTTIIIPWDDYCKELLEQAKWSRFTGGIARKLQRYTVQVFEQEFKEMLNYRILDVVADKFYVLSDDFFKTYYSKELGLLPCTDSMFLNDILII